MPKKEYHKWSKDKLVHEIKTLLKRKKFGLVWEDKEEDLATKCEDFLPVLSEVKKKKIQNDKSDLQHIIIEGDNYHALSTLCYTHKKKIDVIYIDPPYNTGNKDFVYNDNYIDKEDRFRHSKWLSFISKRLKLAKYLLKDSGIIIVSIDDNEVAQLKLLMDDPSLFGENNFIALLPTIMNLKGNNDQFGFAGTHEYTLVYAKDKSLAKLNQFAVDEEDVMKEWEEDDYGFYKKGANLKATGTNAPREKRPNLFYPIFFKSNGDFYTTENDKPLNKNDKTILPITDNKEMSWRWSKKKLNKEKHNVIISENGEMSLYKKQRPQLGDLPTKKPKSLFYKPEYSSGNGTAQLKELFGDKVFDNPKPLDLIKDLLYLTTDKDSVVLDFMAGSGTTAIATLLLNQEDKGTRKFILCTNNELNGIGTKLAKENPEINQEEIGICQRVCYPRLERVMNGYTNPKKQKVDGLGGNLRYYKTDFVNQVRTDTDKRKLVNKSTEMLCLTENTFDKVIEEKDFYAIFESSERMTGIIYDEDAIDDFNEEIKKFNKPLSVYIFSYDHTYNKEDFADIKNLVEVKPIPEVILNVYRKIYKNIRKSKTS